MTTTALQRPVSRNDPCPCGSGKRFKDCHGSLRGDTPTAIPSNGPRRSRYRPAGDDWAGLDADACDRLGVLMEAALKHQLEQQMRDAERLYRAVLEEAPRSHDALHMLAVVRLGLGDFIDAERLIRSAMPLRPSYAAIEQNWSIVRRSIAARDRRGVEVVCEHALPLLLEAFDGARLERRGGSPLPADAPLHLVGPGGDPAADDVWMTRRLGDLLAPLEPIRWQSPDREREPPRWRHLQQHAIEPATGRRPQAGVVVLAGVECDTDAWLRDPIDRVLVFMLSAAPSVYLERLRRIAADGARSVTLVFDSNAKARRFGREALVVPPPIDLSEFPDDPIREHAVAAATMRIATVGQDGRRVTVADDLDLLLAIAERAGKLLLLDPGPLRYHVGMSPAVQCIARGERTLAQFLGDADVYLHRVRPWWTEDAGRVLFGAMALGVPVLCPRESIYAECIDDGVDGWLYDDDAAALSAIDALRAEPARRAEAGRAARDKARRMFEAHALADAYVNVVRRWIQA